MQANANFANMDSQFWAHVRFVSERLGYSTRKKRGETDYKGKVISHSLDEIENIIMKENLTYDINILIKVKNYLDYRAEILNNFVEPNLMMSDKASIIFENLKKQLFDDYNYNYTSVMNKQKGNKKKPAYFTGIIDILTIHTLIENTGSHIYENDPKKLVYTTNDKNQISTVLSRRFDGAYPSLIDPKVIWEIKEYYYTTTFGSRISDGVYETQLDGFEINQIEDVINKPIYHVFFTDAYDTWWLKGRSYLCRLVDALHMGLLDELIIGQEVVDRWPSVLKNIINNPQ